jgi:long-chain acyl-CoA synthetase
VILRVYLWGELTALARALTALLAECGAPSDAPVGFVGRNHPAALTTLIALLAERRTIQMIYPFQSALALAKDIEKLKPALLIAETRDLGEPVIEALKQVGGAAIALDGMSAHALPGLERANQTKHAAVTAGGETEPQIQILTSGTTGPPKRFPIGYSMIERHLLGGAATPGASQTGAADPVPYLLFMPLGNISGIYTTIPPLLRGRTVTLLERFSLEAWREFVVRYRPEASGVPPATVQALLDANIPPEDLASIKFMGIGAAPLDINVQRAFEERYGIPMMLSYGATEFGGPVATMTPADIRTFGFTKRGSVGRALGAAKLRVVDADSGAELPSGREGLLEVVSPRIGPDWLRTADLAMIDADGFLYIRGRTDGAIMRGGFKLLPETIERALMLHPSIGGVAVVGVDDVRLGQVPGAAIEIKARAAALTAAEAEQHLREHVPSTHIPVHWRFVDELPKTPSMKIDRPAVKRLFEEGT